MPIAGILTFIAISVFIILVGLSIFFTFYNKRTKSAIDRFIGIASELRPLVFQDLRLSYLETSGLKTYPFSNNRCDLYLFENYLAIVRRHDFVFKVFFPPILLSSDVESTKKIFYGLETYKPDRIMFKQKIKGEIAIKLTDPTFQKFSIDITLKGLTKEQTIQIEKLGLTD